LAEENTNETEDTSDSMTRLDTFLLVAVAIAAFIVFMLLGYSLYFQLHTYKFGIEQALKNQESAIALAYSKANDFAITKTSTVFLGFVLAFLGALYVLRTTRVPFVAKATGSAKATISLQTSSPGLVMIALGVLTINLALFSKSFVGVDVESPQRVPAVSFRPGGNSPTSFRLPPFSVGKAELNPAQVSALSKLADDMIANPNKQYTIDGETDPNESTEYSMGLADRRASTVKQFLVGQGIVAARVQIISYGKERPLGTLGRGSSATIRPTDQPKN